MIKKIPNWVSILSIILNLFFCGYIAKKILLKHFEGVSTLPYSHDQYRAYSKSRIVKTDIVFVGDSQTDRFPISEMFNNITLKNRGVSGDKSGSVLKRMDTIVNAKPRKIFLCVGINDLLYEIPVDTVVGNIYKAILLIKTKSPTTQIYVQSLFPTSWKKFDGSEFVISDEINANSKLEKICKQNNVQFIDLFDKFKENSALNIKYDCGDHLHLGEQGYVKWKEILNPYL